MARSTDAALNGLHTAILERLMPLAELVLFLLGELRGAVLAAGAESWMGLQVRASRLCRGEDMDGLAGGHLGA